MKQRISKISRTGYHEMISLETHSEDKEVHPGIEKQVAYEVNYIC